MKCRTEGGTVLVVEVPDDGNHADMVARFAHAIQNAKSGSVKLAIIDHISSKPAMLFPVKDLVTMCNDNGIATLVDGAHTVGSTSKYKASHPDGKAETPVLSFGTVDETDCTFFCCTFHKWGHTPRPSGGIYTNPRTLQRFASFISLEYLASDGRCDIIHCHFDTATITKLPPLPPSSVATRRTHAVNPSPSLPPSLFSHSLVNPSSLPFPSLKRFRWVLQQRHHAGHIR
jgi:hypothetical protein